MTGLMDAVMTWLIYHLPFVRRGSVFRPAGASEVVVLQLQEIPACHWGTSSPDAEQQQHQATTLDADMKTHGLWRNLESPACYLADLS